MAILGSIILFLVVGIFGFIGAKFGFTFRASILFFFGIFAGIDFVEGFNYDPTRNYSWAFIAGALIDRFITTRLNKSAENNIEEKSTGNIEDK